MPGQRCSMGSNKKLGQWIIIKTNKLWPICLFLFSYNFDLKNNNRNLLQPQCCIALSRLKRVELTTIGITAIEISYLTRFTLPLLIRIQRKMWRNHHATTILNFLVAHIAAMNSIQFDFDKSGNCPDTVMKNALPPSLPPFFKGQAGQCLFFPAFQRPCWFILYFEMLKVRWELHTALCKI